MRFERRLTHFSLYLFGFADFSRKRPFFGGDSGVPKLLNFATQRESDNRDCRRSEATTGRRRCARMLPGAESVKVTHGYSKMSAEARAVASPTTTPVSPRPVLSRNNIRVLFFFIVFMTLNTVMRYIPNFDEPRISFAEMGRTFGTGVASLLLFGILCKGLDIARRIKLKENLVFISMAVIGLCVYVAFFVMVAAYIFQSSATILLVVVFALPLIPAVYFVVGFIIGLFARMIASDQPKPHDA
jgi:hypothetical protein